MFVYEFQITQLKIASNPFAKGFRDCDPEDWWAFALKQIQLHWRGAHSVKKCPGAFAKKQCWPFVLSHSGARWVKLATWKSTMKFRNDWIRFWSQSTVFFCHWQITSRSSNCLNPTPAGTVRQLKAMQDLLQMLPVNFCLVFLKALTEAITLKFVGVDDYCTEQAQSESRNRSIRISFMAIFDV